MNKILVVDNKIIPFDNNDVLISNNTIEFNNNGNYYIEYIDSNNISLNLKLKENICINLFIYSNNMDININNTFNLYKNSSLIVNKFYANKNTNDKTDIHLIGHKANIKYNFSNISTNNDNYTINIYHDNKNTCSDIYNRTIAKEGSCNVFDINSFVDNGTLDCYLNQQTKIITLGNSNNKVNPNMFIGESTTNALHSSAIGSVNENDLFYIMSRGIDYNTSVNLIVKGMILSNINVNMEYREKILRLLDNLGGD